MIQKFDAERVRPRNDYPTSDGKPMAETDIHRDLMFALIDTLRHRYADDPDVYVSGNLLVFYEEGNKRRHLSPDVFVVFGVPKGERENYLLWEEGKGPDVVIELTSSSTRNEDTRTKFDLYRERLGVREYFLFDPRSDYLYPSMQGYRRVSGEFRPIREKDGRLPSKRLGLHLERAGRQLRLWDPATERWLPTQAERDEAGRAAMGEVARLRREVEELKRRVGPGDGL